ncbi:MAG: phosphate ABC transporter ATP-binding protein [SAR202 cluster bacterium]|nr:phosphate ABC transporter ATP-binding protein [SAR202 cluster bacterium]
MNESILNVKNLNVWYRDFQALKDVNIDILSNKVTALIGPSGCGKSTMLRCINRMNDLIPDAKVHGEINFNGENINSNQLDPIDIRSKIGMVFQKPNPFPKSIFDNVAFGLRINGFKGSIEDEVEKSLKKAALWEDVKDRLKDGALELSGGQQQRLCIARTLAVNPQVMLMDEPASALDPIATLAIEELIRDLCSEVSIVIVTHNMQQAARISHRTAFFMVDQDRCGYMVEEGETNQIFTDPQDERTESYITGRFS